MSDMSGSPSVLPPNAGHDQHDVLLVAQLAANDPLEAGQRLDASALVSGCPDCASLAADLRVVAGAVAWEPLPPRRRDFRISAAQAERARGSALQRFMRRLALPQAAALRPIAAGVMSLGLVMVLAGNFWPAGATPDGATAPATGPIAEATFGAAALDGLRLDEGSILAGTPGPVAGPNAGDVAESELRAPPQERRPVPDEDAGALGMAVEGDLDGFADDVPRSEASGQGLADVAESLPDVAQKSSAKASGLAAEGPAADGSEELLPDGSSLRQSTTVGELRDRELARESGMVESLAADVTADGATDVSAGSEPGALEADLAQALPVDDGIGFETVLIVLGAVLAVGGLILLLLMWVARRRHPDPARH